MRANSTSSSGSFHPPLDPKCSLIQLRDVNKIYHTHAGEFPALKGVNLCFGEGEFVGIIGKSGSGKSTLINMISGIDHPSSGSVRVGNSDIHKMKEGQLAVWRGRTLGIVFQFFQLLPMLSVLENTILPMDFCNMYDPMEREQRAMALLELVGLEHEADSLPAALSGGQQQIAAIARALANDPPIIVADEPTGNLDSKTAARIMDIFDDLVAKKKTILIVTHDSALAGRASRRVLISDGEIINESVSSALPMLPHPTMLQISHLAQPRAFAPGELISGEGYPPAGLLIVTCGAIEVFSSGENGNRRILGKFGEGQYISELELDQTKYPGLGIRAAPEEPLQTLWVDHPTFEQVLNNHSHAAQNLAHLADERSLHFEEMARQKTGEIVPC
jgi:putative ABC transport system ATP-binding protein